MGGGDANTGGEPAAAPPATLHIRCTNGSKFAVRADLDATVGAFKAIVAENCDVPPQQQRLIYKGRILKDEQTLASCGVETDHTIHMVRGAVPPPASTAPAANQKTSATTTASSPAAGLGGLMQGLGATGAGNSGGLGLFGSGLPELDQMQQQLAENPNLMREIMNMPLMQNIMNSPDLIRNIIMNNPQMRELIDRNPDLAHVLNDPSILRQTVEAARNPELMREMMRNTDRAMSNIESSPEGFNMLRRMYETVQEPFLNATTMGGEGDRNPNPFAALLGNQGSNQARDTAANAPTTASDSITGSPAPNANPLPNPWSPTAGSAQGAASPSPASNTRSATTGGLGGLGSADLGSMLGGGSNASFLSQVLQDPTMMRMMQNIMSNPQSMNQLLNINPNVRNMMESNTQLREMFQNPEFLRQLTSPETLQQLISFQQSLMSQLGQQQAGQERTQPGTGAGNVNLNTLMSMFSGLGAGGGLGVPNTPNVPPEELYATQLAQLQEMGFFDTQENLRALIATAGNVHAAVERLLGNLGQ
ncbi:ubiquitin domain-containing protein DSK2a-like isoform X1 [Phragmites australis]|uniref:ubiquitin domain-containing protein DSK2a-like isoform X1 n=2 Tax=Phragmites australis TaxID=29695 RepID=UPI002D797C70|nr:ubiquitin domain-containing protein DSK2a-like isoform X1 [Phragmites australis]XP_062209755.1 ubiquitin domain-containing protein DSK2a-like isoform X1 [Phragmites australis]